MDSLMPNLQNLDLGDDIDENMLFSAFHSLLKRARNEIAVAERNRERTEGGAAAKGERHWKKIADGGEASILPSLYT